MQVTELYLDYPYYPELMSEETGLQFNKTLIGFLTQFAQEEERENIVSKMSLMENPQRLYAKLVDIGQDDIV